MLGSEALADIGNLSMDLNLGSPVWLYVVLMPLPFGIVGLVMLVGAAGRARGESGFQGECEDVSVKSCSRKE